MLYLVNTMEGNDQVYGRILSCHKTVENAVKSDKKIQKGLGQGQYLPTIIVQSTERLKSGNWAYIDNCNRISDEDYMSAQYQVDFLY